MNPFALVDAARFFQRYAAGNAALLNTMAAVATAGLPPMSRAFQANAATASLIAHEPKNSSDFGITETVLNGMVHRVEEVDEVVLPHARLTHFRKPDAPPNQPKLLVLSPLSGHPATLIGSEIEELLPDHDVFTVKWHDPAHVPLRNNGSLDLNGYIDYLIKFMEHIGPQGHVIAICQPGVPLTAALSYMSEKGHPCLPLSATFKGSPIDTRHSPTDVNKGPALLKRTLGSEGALEFMRHALLQEVPFPYPGHGQLVHNRFNQLAGFLSLDPGGHTTAYARHWLNVASGQARDDVTRHEAFYKGYNHVENLPGDYLLGTNDVAFINQRIPDGTFVYTPTETGEPHLVNPANIQGTMLFVVEGEGDTITGLGQTAALLNMAEGLQGGMKYYRRSPKGHYGLFAGGDFRDHTAPQTRWIIRESAAHAGVSYPDSDKPVVRPQRFSIDEHPALARPAPAIAA